MARPSGIPSKRSFLAIHELDRLEIEPIAMMKLVYDRAMAAFEQERGHSEKGDAGAAYLAVCGQMAKALAGFKYPTLSAIAVKDASEASKDSKPLTTAEAVKIIQSDPFLAKQMNNEPKEISVLPIGEGNK
jgi:hypothetical protein